MKTRRTNRIWPQARAATDGKMSTLVTMNPKPTQMMLREEYAIHGIKHVSSSSVGQRTTAHSRKRGRTETQMIAPMESIVKMS